MTHFSLVCIYCQTCLVYIKNNVGIIVTSENSLQVVSKIVSMTTAYATISGVTAICTRLGDSVAV